MIGAIYIPPTLLVADMCLTPETPDCRKKGNLALARLDWCILQPDIRDRDLHVMIINDSQKIRQMEPLLAVSEIFAFYE